jgi:cytidylate kinase
MLFYGRSARLDTGATRVIVAIDGPSASGKGTIAKALAKHLGFHYLDTGALYRMVGLVVQRRCLDPKDEAACAAIAASLDPSAFVDAELRGELVGGYASKVAILPKVRAALLAFQRSFAQRQPGAVLDGRDIGTIVCPDADYKFYITATAEARAQRRFRETPGSDLGAILADIQARDERDSTRTLAPLRPAADALIVDTTDLTIKEAFARVLAKITA